MHWLIFFISIKPWCVVSAQKHKIMVVRGVPEAFSRICTVEGFVGTPHKGGRLAKPRRGKLLK